MSYKVYKNISDSDIARLQERLLRLKSRILSLFPDLTSDSRSFEDFLVLNFVIADHSFESNLAVLYNDYPDAKLFDMTLLKAFDQGKFRYFKKEYIAKDIALELLESNLEGYIKQAIDTYFSWRKIDLENAGKVELE